MIWINEYVQITIFLGFSLLVCLDDNIVDDIMDIFERMKKGELSKLDDPEYKKVYEAILRASKITAELNSSYYDREEIR